MNNSLHHHNYNNSGPENNSNTDNNQLDFQQSFQQPLLEEEMLQMQRASQFPLSAGYYTSSSSYLDGYPAPSPPALAPGPSLLNEREVSTLHGFLETVTANEPNLFGPGFTWEDEPPYTLGPAQQLHSYMNTPLQSSTHNVLNNISSEVSPALSNTANPMNVPSASAVTPPIIVNPFNEAHGLLPHSNNSQTPPEAAALNTLAWGSDPHFANSGYHPPVPPINQDQEMQQKVMSMVRIDESGASTTTNSPVEIKFERIGEDLAGSDGSSNFASGTTQSPTLSANQSSGVKRRAEDDEDHQQQARKSRTRKEPFNEPKPKKGGKREQLTEAEKRANHIQSEQKRRNQIKIGFDTLTEMVPDLKGGGYSKSAILQHAAVYVSNLIGGNARLREMLRNLEEQHKAAGHGVP